MAKVFLLKKINTIKKRGAIKSIKATGAKNANALSCISTKYPAIGTKIVNTIKK